MKHDNDKDSYLKFLPLLEEKRFFKMVRELNMDTQRQNFWKESIHKEATVRLDWHMRFSKEFTNKSLRSKNKQNSVVQMNSDAVKLPPIDCNKHKRRGMKIVPPKANPQSEKESNKALLVEMRPVSSDTHKLLYKGFSALGEGRYAYLQQRKQRKPEDKYEFPITSAWEYGWKVTEAMKNASTQPAEFGRSRIVKDSFYRTNGVF